MKPFFKPELILPALIISAGIFFGLLLYSQAGDDVINACARKDGLLHLIGSGFKRTECTKNETAVSWNMEGPAGPQGPAGQNLHLFDANGQDVGVLLDAELYAEAWSERQMARDLHLGLSPKLGISTNVRVDILNSDLIPDAKLYRTWVPDVGVIALFAELSRSQTIFLVTPLSGGIMFEGADCGGAGFSINRDDRVWPGPNALLKASGPRYFQGDTNTSARVGSSMLPESGDPCISVATSSPNAIVLEEVTLPFSEPLAWPLEIREQ